MTGNKYLFWMIPLRSKILDDLIYSPVWFIEIPFDFPWLKVETFLLSKITIYLHYVRL